MYGNNTVFLILFCFVCSLALAQPNSDLMVDGFENGVQLRFELAKNHFYECEEIILSYTTSSDTMALRRSASHDIGRCIRVIDEMGSELKSFDIAIDRIASSPKIYSSFVSLSSKYFNVEFDGPNRSFVHIKPGRYEIQYRCSPPMPPLVFVIDPNPDSLKEAWDKYSSIEVMYQGRHSLSLSREEVLLQTTELLHYFMNLPVGYRLRKEALGAGLTSFSLNREAWSRQDSVNCCEFLHAYATEPTVEIKYVLLRANNTIFKELPSKKKIKQIRAYAKLFNDPAAMDAAESMIKQIRDIEQQE